MYILWLYHGQCTVCELFTIVNKSVLLFEGKHKIRSFEGRFIRFLIFARGTEYFLSKNF